MKRFNLLVWGALTSALFLPGAGTAWGIALSDTATHPAPRSRARLAVKSFKPKRQGVSQAQIHTKRGGLQLKLATTLQKPPAGASEGKAAEMALALPAVAPPALPPSFSAYAPPSVPFIVRSADNPYLPKRGDVDAASPSESAQTAATMASPFTGTNALFSSIAYAIPILPQSGRSILPSIKKVYPTGEKPLVVVSFKCPVELVGVTPPTIQILHQLVNLGMEGINRTDLLSFNLQQVCE